MLQAFSETFSEDTSYMKNSDLASTVFPDRLHGQLDN